MSARTSLRQLAALAATLRAADARIAGAGGPRSPAVDQVLALVDAKVRGERVTKAALDRAAKAASAAASAYGPLSAPAEKAASWAWDAVAKLGWMAASGRDDAELVLTHASYGWLDPGVGSLARYRLVHELHERSLAAASDVSAEPIAKPPARVNPREVAALAAARKALGRDGAQLNRAGAARDVKRMAPRGALAKLLAKLGYTAHAAVLAFDAAFGGLLVPSDRDDDWREQRLYSLVGTYACLRDGGHGRPRGGAAQRELALVPITFAPPDGVVYLDARGRAYAQDTVGDIDATPFADDGKAALVKLLESAPPRAPSPPARPAARRATRARS